MDTDVSALFRSDGPGTAGILRPRGGFIVLAFSSGVADGMNRRKIQNVEAHRRDVGEPGLAIAERPMAAGSDAQDRGNISYQAEKPAFSRSTITQRSSHSGRQTGGRDIAEQWLRFRPQEQLRLPPSGLHSSRNVRIQS